MMAAPRAPCWAVRERTEWGGDADGPAWMAAASEVDEEMAFPAAEMIVSEQRETGPLSMTIDGGGAGRTVMA